MFDNITMTATRIDSRPDWEGEAVHWSISINGEADPTFYSEGIGHFMQQGADKLAHEPLKLAIQGTGNSKLAFNGNTQWAIKTGVKKDRVKIKNNRVEVIPPKLEDVLYSLTMDASCVDQGFDGWCDDYGYDTDSIKARETYDACVEGFFKLRRLGLDLEELQEHFQDY